MTLDDTGTVLFASDDCADYIGLTPVSVLTIQLVVTLQLLATA